MRRGFRVSDRGASFVEYGAVVLLVAAVLAVVVTTVPFDIRDFLNGTLDRVETADGERPQDTGDGPDPQAAPPGDRPEPEQEPVRPDPRGEEPVEIDPQSTWPYNTFTVAPAVHTGGGSTQQTADEDEEEDEPAGPVRVDPEDSPFYEDPGTNQQLEARETSEQDYASNGEGSLNEWCSLWDDTCCPDRTCQTHHEVNQVVAAVRTACLIGWDTRCYPDAADYFEHFLYGGGETMDLDMERFMTEVPEFAGEVDTQQDELAQSAVEEARRMGAEGPVTFPIRTGWEPYGYPPDDPNGGDFVYDDSNWNNAIGSFHYNLAGEVTVTPPAEPDGEWTYEISTDVTLQKMYDWERDNESPAVNGLPGRLWPFSQSDLADLHQWGLAEEFWIEGSRNVTSTG